MFQVQRSFRLQNALNRDRNKLISTKSSRAFSSRSAADHSISIYGSRESRQSPINLLRTFRTRPVMAGLYFGRSISDLYTGILLTPIRSTTLLGELLRCVRSCFLQIVKASAPIRDAPPACTWRRDDITHACVTTQLCGSAARSEQRRRRQQQQQQQRQPRELWIRVRSRIVDRLQLLQLQQ